MLPTVYCWGHFEQIFYVKCRLKWTVQDRWWVIRNTREIFECLRQTAMRRIFWDISTIYLVILRSVIPVVYIRTIVDQWSNNSSQKHNYICMYNSVPTTCFSRFLTGHHQVAYNVGGTTYLLKYSHWWQCECSVRGGGNKISFTTVGRALYVHY